MNQVNNAARSMLAEQASGSPSRLGQGTAVEQSRAIAEVQGALVVAQNRPRSVDQALLNMRQSAGMAYLAERAFFRFPRGGQTVSGKSVHLARELARCWGNIDYGVKELSRDDHHGQSEMLAFAWDLETNTRNETTFIVPHLRDKKGGPERLIDMRDIYENNANNGARRLRECILGVLPPWYVEEAADLCHKTLESGDSNKPMPQRIADCIEAFIKIGVTKEQLQRKVGSVSGQWTPQTLASLGVIHKSVLRGEISKDEEFPREETGSATVDALKEQAGAARQAEKPKPTQQAKEPEQPKGPAPVEAQAETGDAAGQVEDAASEQPAQTQPRVEDPEDILARFRKGLSASPHIQALDASWDEVKKAGYGSDDELHATYKARETFLNNQAAAAAKAGNGGRR